LYKHKSEVIVPEEDANIQVRLLRIKPKTAPSGLYQLFDIHIRMKEPFSKCTTPIFFIYFYNPIHYIGFEGFTAVRTRSTRRHIPEDGILPIHYELEESSKDIN
jgi:hypothetical protein